MRIAITQHRMFHIDHFEDAPFASAAALDGWIRLLLRGCQDQGFVFAPSLDNHEIVTHPRVWIAILGALHSAIRPNSVIELCKIFHKPSFLSGK